MTNNTHSFGFSIESIHNLFTLRPQNVAMPAITVHNGEFHADDVCAVALVKLFAADFGWCPVTVIRTRDINEAAGVCVDVFEGDFDHHGSRAGLDPNGVPWSGVSRLWAKLVDSNELQDSRPHQLFYERVLKPLSKIDNGVKLDEGETSMFSWVRAFNPGYGDEDQLEAGFDSAVDTAMNILRAAWTKAQADARGEEVMESVIEEAKTKYVVDVPAGLNNLWPRKLAATKAVFVIIHSPDGTYYVQAVPTSDTDLFSSKVLFKEEYRGLRDQALAEKSGLANAVFCHAVGFIAGFKTHESALNFALMSILDDAADCLFHDA